MSRSARLGLAVLLALATPPACAESPADSEARGAELVKQQCASCHRFEGEPASKFSIRAPDLMWGGQKYQRAWLLGWLEGREKSPYPGPYRWDEPAPAPHPALSAPDAAAVADYFDARLSDPRVREGAFDPASVTKLEVQLGAALFRESSCIGCHPVLENGKPRGGPISTHFFDAGRRYDPDWVYAFNLNPASFTPHSGEYVADVTERRVGWVTAYLMTLGVEDFAYARPWESEAFRNADSERGSSVYRNYCAQCHGLSGAGDGPGAAGLEPKPASHAQMAMAQLSDEYLFGVVFHGGSAVGKSSNMPDWGLTLKEQEIADVVRYMKTAFAGAPAPAADAAVCPQPRQTPDAPAELRQARNPLAPTPEHLAAGEKLYRETAVPMACQFCHGERGDGLGPLAAGYTPRPRNLTCAETMAALPDGQLFWVIRNGSPGTGMLAYAPLSDEQIWQLVLFVRGFAP
jgi:mono/diheme cytochrome c family protein